jgi:hypothetical protein
MLSGDLIRALVSGEGEAYTSLSVSASSTFLLHKPSFLSVLVILIHSSHLNNSAFILHRVSLFQPCVSTHVVLRGNVRDGTRHRYSGSDRRQLRPHIRCVQHLHSSQSRYAPVPILSYPCLAALLCTTLLCTVQDCIAQFLTGVRCSVFLAVMRVRESNFHLLTSVRIFDINASNLTLTNDIVTVHSISRIHLHLSEERYTAIAEHCKAGRHSSTPFHIRIRGP